MKPTQQSPSRHGQVTHRHLGKVEITLKCMMLQKINTDPSSVYVEHDGEVIEVSKSLIEELKEEA